ncbi:MAG: GntR family transcriptional regulator [bacterium]|nr:GntR family transcriptional regulator [bacterium]
MKPLLGDGEEEAKGVLFPLSRKPLRDSVYEALRTSIRVGAFEPGEKLNIDHLARKFQVSRTPVREALQRLNMEEFVVFSPGRGFEIRRPTLDELTSVYELRENLESLAAAMASSRRTDEDIARIRSALERSREAFERGDLVALAEANDAFDGAVGSAAHNRFLEEMLARCHVWAILLRLSSTRMPGRWEAIIDEHSRIAEAIERGDGDRARMEALVHRRNALASAEQILKEG